ncbi:MAG: IS200/IS605 family transposase [Nanoarchaeota archaeon]|nr:IS200/IS605 family transposase [Nanoarchaeota archaeon]
MFRKLEYQNLVSACIRRAASLHQIKIIELNVQSEHVHCIVSFEFVLSASRVLQILKGLSAKLFFGYHAKARLRYPRGHLWSREKFISSVGFVQLDVVQNYIRTQGIHHGNRTLKCAEDVMEIYPIKPVGVYINKN